MVAYLMTGSDEVLLRQGVHDLVDQLVGSGDRSLMVDEFEGAEYTVAEIIDAAQTLPFLAERRVVVARGVGRFGSDQTEALVAYLDDPSPTTELVLVGGGGQIPKALVDAVKRSGGVVSGTEVPTGRKGAGEPWITTRAEAAGVRLDNAAIARVAAWLGADLGRLDGILAALVSTYGAGVRLGPGDVEPFLGDAGDVPPWDLTDAIDAGHVDRALTVLHRMIGSGSRHPLQVMATLHTHYARMARLDGAGASSDTEAAAVLGLNKTFQAQKALRGLQRLGADRVRRAIDLLATADLDLRGGTALDGDTVMQVLVARLARLRPGGR